MSPRYHLLFLCTGNSARSILAEAIANDLSQKLLDGVLEAHSAGSAPAGVVNPGAVVQLTASGHDVTRLRSKSWNEFTGPDTTPMDWVITLCDSAAQEACPVFPGPCERLHWGLPDPAQGAISFAEAYAQLAARLRPFIEELGRAGE